MAFRNLIAVLRCRSKYVFRTIPKSKLCSTDVVGNEEFRDIYNIPQKLVRRMSKLGIVTPTGIQKKVLNSLSYNSLKYFIISLLIQCLGSLLDSGGSWCSVINAETGSGKTLCMSNLSNYL